jgi:hypothetical protein
MAAKPGQLAQPIKDPFGQFGRLQPVDRSLILAAWLE